MIDPIITNDSQRIARHLNNASEGQTVVINPGVYTITEDIEVVNKNEIKILAHGAKFKQAGCNKPLHFKGCKGVTLEGIEMLGEGGTLTSGTQTSFTGISGIYATDPTDWTVYKTKVKGFLGSGIRWTGAANNVHISKCLVAGVGSDFITHGANGNDVGIGGYVTTEDINTRIVDNDISGHAFGTFLTHPVAASILGNYYHDIPGQHGIYISHGQDMSVVNNRFKRCALIAIKFQVTDGSTFSDGILITGNNISECETGVELNTTLTNGKFLGGFKNSIINGNLITRSKSYGIVTDASINCSIASNTIDKTDAAFGMMLKYFSGSINSNIVGDTFWNAMYITAQDTISIANNTIYDFVRSTVAPRTYRELYGIHLTKDVQNTGPDTHIAANANIFKGSYPSLVSCIRAVAGTVLHENASVNLTGETLIAN